MALEVFSADNQIPEISTQRSTWAADRFLISLLGEILWEKISPKMNGTGNQSANGTTCFSSSSTISQDVEAQVLGHEGGLRTEI